MYSVFFLYAVFGAALGIAVGLLINGYRPGDNYYPLLPNALWVGLVGLFFGMAVGTYQTIVRLSQETLKNRRNVIIYRPVECAWCKGKGKKSFFIFNPRCGACRGQGSVLAAEKSKKCAWCKGTGGGAVFRCEVCEGTGWAHSTIDEV